MLELVLVVTLIIVILALGVISLDQLKRWFLGLANDLIDLRKKWELSQIQVEEKRLELEQKFNSNNSD